MNRRNKQELQAIVIIGLLIVSLVMGQISPAKANGEISPLDQASSSGVDGFHLISVDQGWVVLDNRLYWTADGGNSWNLISASLPNQSTIAGVEFLDSSEGRVLMVDSAGEDPVYSLGRTHDGGMTWETAPLVLFSPGDVNAIPDNVYMQWLDPQIGWLVIKRATSINFSIGSLFRTNDGGLTWNQLTIPIGDEVAFITPEIGWVAGGAAGDELYRTVDGGATWVSQAFVQSTGIASWKHAYLLPKFQDADNGLLPIMFADENNVRMDFYLTNDGGQSWKMENSIPLDENVDLSVLPPLTMFDGSHFTMVVPHTNRIVTEQGPQQDTTIYSADGRSADLSVIEMASMDVGLGVYTAGDCVAQAANVPTNEAEIKGNLSCTQTKQLVKTTDGGETWKLVALPGDTGAIPSGNSSVASANGSLVNINYRQEGSYSYDSMIGQGVDICDIPTANQLQSWWSDSPYGAVNLYIGGSLRGCQNSRLTSALVSQLFNQGWKFIPTWVGPQAPCSSFRSRVSFDPDTAYHQGIVEADAAITAASNLGLTNPDGSNTVIYYDLEGYNTGDVSCRDAMKSFIDGWDEELAAKGNKSAVYGSSCASALRDFATIAHVPDAIWPAWWNFSTYNSNASVLGILCLSDSYWSNHQRIHQYAGGHNESWGNITLNIDANVLDGILAVPYQGNINLAPSKPVNPKPNDGGILPRVNDTWLYWSTNGSSCNLHIWGGNIDTTPGGNCTSLHLGQQDPGAYLWQVTANNTHGSTIGLAWHFNIQPYPPTEVTLGTVTSTQIDLGWTLSADDPVNLDGYDVYFNNQNVSKLPKGTNSSTVSDLTCNSVFSIFLRSNRQNVQSTNSNSVTTTTGSCVGVTHTITGNAGVAGAIISYIGSSTTADSTGAYSFPVSDNWSGTVTPSLAGYVFSPASRAYSNVQADQTLQDYTAKPINYTISGNTGVGGVKLSYTDGSQKTTIANGNGDYLFEVSYNWSGTLTPALADYIFSPADRVYTAVLDNQTHQDFIALPLPGNFGKTSPTKGATNQPTNPTLSWGTSASATSYAYCVNTTATCTTWISIGTNTGATLTGLTPGTYYWQVRAVNGAGITYANGTSTAWWSFTVLQAPGAFNKISPGNGLTNRPINPALSWGTSASATSYAYCINTTVSCTTWISTGASTSVALSGLTSGTYYWQLRAVNGAGTTYANGTSTAWWSFIILPLPGAFSKSSPINGATNQPTTPT